MLVIDNDGVRRLSERSTRALALIRALRDAGLWPPIAPTVVLVESLQGHSGRDANANRFLKTCVIEDVVTEPAARRAAELRRRAGHRSAVDAIVVALAEPGGTVLTGAEGVPARGDGELVQSTDVHDSEASTGRPIGEKRSVELSSYLRSRWGVMLVVVPAIAGAIAFAAAKPPERFDAVGLVSVTPPDAIESSQFSTGPFVADFRSVLTSTAVEDAVEEALATTGAELLGSASASAGLNGGALVQVGITASTPEAAELAIRTVVAESLTVLNRQNVERAEIVAAARTAETRAAQSALTDFATVNQVQDVAGEYARRSGDLLETRNVVASNPGNSALRALLEEKRAELDQYGALLLEWQLLEDALRTAVSASGSANAALSLARARADSVGDRNLLESVAVTQAGEVTGRATAGAIGALAALAAVGLAATVARRNKLAQPKRSEVVPQDPPTQEAPVENAGADTAPSPR